MLRPTEVYIVEYHAGGGGTSRKRLCDYAPHFYRLETEDGVEVALVLAVPANTAGLPSNGKENRENLSTSNQSS